MAVISCVPWCRTKQAADRHKYSFKLSSIDIKTPICPLSHSQLGFLAGCWNNRCSLPIAYQEAVHYGTVDRTSGIYKIALGDDKDGPQLRLLIPGVQ